MRLTEATTEYQRHLRARGLAESTVRNTTQVLTRAADLWGDIDLRDLDHAHIDSLFDHYQWRESTRNLYLSRVNSFLGWARSRHYLTKDVTKGWRAIRVPKTERTRVPLEDFPALLDASAHPRDRAVCALGLFTFLRGSEIQSLRVSDLDLGANSLSVYRHKTKQSDTLPVSSELHAEMVRWLNWYRADQGALRSHWFLVPAKNPNHTYYDRATGRIGVDTSTLASLRPTSKLTKPYSVIQRSLSALGYTVYWEGEHTLRRSGARALADTLRDQGYDGALMRVASMLGHSDTRITEKYIGWELERSQRNEAIAGKPMFPALHAAGTVTALRKEA